MRGAGVNQYAPGLFGCGKRLLGKGKESSTDKWKNKESITIFVRAEARFGQILSS